MGIGLLHLFFFVSSSATIASGFLFLNKKSSDNESDNRKSDLSHLYSKYGEISTIYVDENKGFAFVEFTSSAEAQRALEHTNNKTVNGAKLRVEYAKSDKVSRRPISRDRDRSPTSALYNHLQVTANRLPPMQVFRQNYHQSYSSSLSRGRSLTPLSFKQNSRLPAMHHLSAQDFYYPHPTIYSDPAYYRMYGGDPYLMQRLPPHSPPSYHRHMSTVSQYRRSRRRTSPSRREQKRKRRKDHGRIRMQLLRHLNGNHHRIQGDLVIMIPIENMPKERHENE